MKRILTVALIVLAAALSLSADIYVKTKTHTDAMTVMGQTTPASDSVAETWIADDKTAMVLSDQIFIVDLARKTAFFVNPADKSYVEAPLPIDIAKLLPPEAAAMAGMMKMSATVAATGETRKVGTWNCQGYDQTMSIMGMPIKSRVWASTETPIDMARYAGLYGAILQGQMRLDDASVKEMMKIKGYPILTETSGEIMGAKMRSTTEVLEISKKTAPAGIYAVPAGFKKNATLNLESMMKR